MAKKCIKCSKKYDDSWGVCLFCGDKLKDHECCEEENKEKEVKSLEGLAFIAAIAVIFIVIIFLLYFYGIEYWINVIENILSRVI